MKAHLLYAFTAILIAMLYCATWIHVEARADKAMVETARMGCTSETAI